MYEYMPRTTKPVAGNKYYITKKSGGYNPCITGKPVDAECDALANCVGYAVGRFNEIGGYGKCQFLASTDAKNMIDIAKSQNLAIQNQPTIGGCMVWNGGKSACGHVAIVESINADGSIITSESGYGANKPFWTTKRIGANWGQNCTYKYLGCIVNPAIYRVLRVGCIGGDVREMQKKLADAGYLRKNEIDGDFGKITLGAVCAYQLTHNLTVDGVCGQQTRNALKLF